MDIISEVQVYQNDNIDFQIHTTNDRLYEKMKSCFVNFNDIENLFEEYFNITAKYESKYDADKYIIELLCGPDRVDPVNYVS